MLEDYKKEVLAAYQEKAQNGTLSINLVSLAPGRLRAECIIIYKERPTENDNETLRAFFGAADHTYGYSKAIENIDIDRFRPIKNFVTGITKRPEISVVEILAWLIDFQNRPYQAWRMRGTVIPPVTDGKQKIPTPTPISTPRFKVKIAIVLLTLISAVSIVLYSYIERSKMHCMYWAGDHYQPVACDEKIYQTPIIALDTMKVAHFKKINCPDTITMNSLGKVWYLKIKNKPEFYTSDGYHPIEHTRMLKQLTPYMVRKYGFKEN